jgi:hypothetical protein
MLHDPYQMQQRIFSGGSGHFLIVSFSSSFFLDVACLDFDLIC